MAEHSAEDRTAASSESGEGSLPERVLAGPLPTLLVRGGIGGVLMGLANLVPGISGGTMLLATGVYRAFIASISEVTRLHLRLRPILLLGSIGGAAFVAILTLAGPTRQLVIDERWIMYSVFIGLTLGGVPLVWRLAKPFSPAVGLGALGGLVVMLLMAFVGPSGGGGEQATLLLFLSGVAGASAMILPGVSGGYLLLLLGQYLPILGAVDQFKVGVTGLSDAVGRIGLSVGGLLAAPELAPLWHGLAVVIPVGLGVVVGVVGVSNLLEWLLEHYEKATLGVLLGLLLGAVVGLWPFQQGVTPAAGDVIKGRTLTAETAAEVEPEDWRVERFAPTGGQAAGSVALVGLGLLTTLAIGRLGRSEDAEG